MSALMKVGLCTTLVACLADGALRAPNVPAQKVRHLLLDIEQSVRKAGEDAEVTYATLDTYSQQLELSLQSEIAALNKTLTKLTAVREKYTTQISQASSELHHLSAAELGSKEIASSYQTGTAKVGKKFDGLLVSVKALVALLQNAVITPDGTLITPEEPDARGQPSQVFNAVRRLLSAHKDLQAKYGDVFQAFNPQALLQTGAGAKSLALRAEAPVVRMTPSLLSHTVAALKSIQDTLSNRKTQALGQFEARREKYQSDATSTATNMDVQQGVQAEDEEKAEDLAFSISFTKAVLKRDGDFYARVRSIADHKKELTQKVSTLREQQLATIKNLVDILDGKYNLPKLEQPQAHKATVTQMPSHLSWLWQDHRGDQHLPSFLQPSFLQTGSAPNHQHFSTLQEQIESTIKNKGDTHALLMKIKGMLDQDSTAAMDADNVKDVMAEMQDVLRAAENDQSKAAEAKRRCDSQLYRAKEETQGLKANIALMGTARDHTVMSIKAAKGNLKGISAKIDALTKSSTDFTQIDATAVHTLEDQGRDRSTIMVAVRKAADVAQRALPADQAPAVVLLRQLLKELTDQELSERSYREEQTSLKTAFLQYAQDYVQLLKDRQAHYESSLAVMELHADELGNDELAQSGSLSSGEDLEKESSELCDTVNEFYEEHEKRRKELISILKSVLPKIPDILTVDADGNGN